MNAEEMTERIGLSPDSVHVRGSRRLLPRAVPVTPTWSVECADTGEGFGVGEQIDRLVARLAPHERAIGSLVDELQAQEGPEASSQLSVARWFDAPDGDLDGFQHHLLGWHLDSATISFLAATRASLDVDEYGQDLPWWRPLSRRRYARS